MVIDIITQESKRKQLNKLGWEEEWNKIGPVTEMGKNNNNLHTVNWNLQQFGIIYFTLYTWGWWKWNCSYKWFNAAGKKKYVHLMVFSTSILGFSFRGFISTGKCYRVSRTSFALKSHLGIERHIYFGKFMSIARLLIEVNTKGGSSLSISLISVLFFNI